MGRANESKVYFVKSLMFSCCLSYFHNVLSSTLAFYCRTVHQNSQRRLFYSAFLSRVTNPHRVTGSCQSTMSACASEVTKRLEYLEGLEASFSRVVCLKKKSNIFLCEWPFFSSIQKDLVCISRKPRNFSENRLVLHQ